MLKRLRQREEACSTIKWNRPQQYLGNLPSSSIINVNPKLHTKAQERADAHTATMKVSILSTVAALLLPMATIAAPSEGARGLTKREYAFHGPVPAKVLVQAGVLIALFVQLSDSIFNAAHD